MLTCIWLVTTGWAWLRNRCKQCFDHRELGPLQRFRALFLRRVSGLRTALSNDEKLGIARHAAVAKFNVGGQDNALWEYRFTQPIQGLVLSAIGVGNSFGMPALAVAFDAPLDSIKSVYGLMGFEFKCDQPAELKGTVCEASRDVEPTPPGQPPLAFTVFLTDASEILQERKSLAACTIRPRGGNVFR